MAVTIIPNVTNWSVTPQNGQVGYFSLMNTWLSESTAVIASLQTAINAQNTANREINALATQTENNATLANGLANFQGAWNSGTTYSKGQSVESTTGSKIYYTSKVNSNINHAVTDTNYWLYNPINNKAEKNQTFYIGTTAVAINRASAGLTLTGINIDGTANALNTENNYTVNKITANSTTQDDHVGLIQASSLNSSASVTTKNYWGTGQMMQWSENGMRIGSRIVTYGGSGDVHFTVGNDTERMLLSASTGMLSVPAGINANITGNAATATALSTAVGSAPSYACRAWVNFNGTGAVAIRASGNVSSITDNGVGDYTVNFTTAMQDANYAYAGVASNIAGSGAVILLPYDNGMPRDSNRFRFITIGTGGNTGDSLYTHIAVFR